MQNLCVLSETSVSPALKTLLTCRMVISGRGRLLCAHRYDATYGDCQTRLAEGGLRPGQCDAVFDGSGTAAAEMAGQDAGAGKQQPVFRHPARTRGRRPDR